MLVAFLMARDVVRVDPTTWWRFPVERGGATLVLEGSHRLLTRFYEGLSRKHRNFQHKWHRQQFL